MSRLIGRNDQTSKLLPLFIILGIFGALAIAWFALSSCMGDELRQVISQRLRGRSSRTTQEYGRMRDDPEATAFDINMEDDDDDDDLYHDDDRRDEAQYGGSRYE